MKLVFLDIDGVLNTHDYCPKARSSFIQRDKIDLLNKITDATGAKIVISSAWRYMIHGGAMSLNGFAYMLQTHGLWAEVVGYTQVHLGAHWEVPAAICIAFLKARASRRAAGGEKGAER